MSNYSIYMRHPWVLLQEAHTRFHWLPREMHLLCGLDVCLRSYSNTSDVRIVDIGCGDGLLAPAIARRGLSYLGIDSHPGFIELCQRKYENFTQIDFKCVSAESLSDNFNSQDIIVLNGVVHHLSDTQTSAMLEAIRCAGHLIILDHAKTLPSLLFPQNMQWLVQKLDRGHFVRHKEYFDTFAGWELVQHQGFVIRLVSFPLWPYLCNVYVNNR